MIRVIKKKGLAGSNRWYHFIVYPAGNRPVYPDTRTRLPEMRRHFTQTPVQPGRRCPIIISGFRMKPFVAKLKSF
jgi:hypothetical protein